VFGTNYGIRIHGIRKRAIVDINVVDWFNKKSNAFMIRYFRSRLKQRNCRNAMFYVHQSNLINDERATPSFYAPLITSFQT
jgi:hypothetical protein